MADLDDFFAKKDRKRNKQAKKYSTPDELAKRLEEPRRQEPRARPDDDAPQPAQTHQEEDEWREIEVAKKADYTGLKIQHLTPGQENNTGIEGNTGGASNTYGDQKSKGPWNKAAPEVVETKVEEREPPPPMEIVLPPPPSSKAYVAPAVRNRPAGYVDLPQVRSKFGKPLAPDINNEEFFPVLGGEVRRNASGAGGGGGVGGHGSGGGTWSEASRGPPASARAAPREVATGNRYTSLTHDS